MVLAGARMLPLPFYPTFVDKIAVGIMDPQIITLYGPEFVNCIENGDYYYAYYEVRVLEE